MTKIAENLAKIHLLELKNNPNRSDIRRTLANQLPTTAGIYIFFKDGTPIYIGKAINLKRRVISYFDLDLEPKTYKMISEATELAFLKVTSELESLLLEARLIRLYMPHYNIIAKDDKHPLYIVITKEKYPRVLTVRKIESTGIKNILSIGPFPSSTSVKAVLRMIRRVFPYSDHKITKRGCLYSHIGLCNPCPSVVENTVDSDEKNKLRKVYLLNIKRIKSVLEGRFDGVKKDLNKEMDLFSRKEKYEEAAEVRNKIKNLEYITKPSMPTDFFIENPNLYQDIRNKEIVELKNVLAKYIEIKVPKRIECFDIAHLAGTNPTASMVTFINGEADKSYYRNFKIKQVKGNSDVDSLREVIKRRLNHKEDWGVPDLIIVDGGKPQVATFIKELAQSAIPVVGLAKKMETFVIPITLNGELGFTELRVPRGPVLNLVQRMRDEAHRFARRLHHKLVSKELTSK